MAEPTRTPADPGRNRIMLATAGLGGALLSWALSLAWRRPPEGASDARPAFDHSAAEHLRLLEQEIASHARTAAELTDAKEAAEAANRAKTRFLVGVSHEIRSPLNAVHGYAQLLERGSGIAPREAGRVIRRASEHLADLIDGLLDISRIESGMLKVSRDLVPLPALLDQIAEMFRFQAAEKGLTFTYRPAPDLPPFVRTDEKRLRQILINLLSNAIKYTPNGEAGLAVRYRNMVAEFEVSDTGIGIAPADLSRIFEPFERGGNEAALAQPGTGLGLSISRALARILGGDLTVASTPGKGSRFMLKLMLSEPVEAPAVSARQRPVGGYEGARRTILAVDDDPAQLAVLQGLLRPLGFNVYAAGAGAAGLELARHCRPDLALLDIQMPGLSGWEVARRLRADLGSAIRIIMVSGNAHEFAEAGKVDGVVANGGVPGDGESIGDAEWNAAPHDGFVLKPVALDQLLDMLAAQLGLVWTADVEPHPAPIAEPTPALDGAAVHLAELRRLARLGHVRGLDAKLVEFDHDVPGAAPLIARLREPLRAFDLKAFLKMLDNVDAD